MICKNCGKEVFEYEDKCPFCGVEIKDADFKKSTSLEGGTASNKKTKKAVVIGIISAFLAVVIAVTSFGVINYKKKESSNSPSSATHVVENINQSTTSNDKVVDVTGEVSSDATEKSTEKENVTEKGNKTEGTTNKNKPINNLSGYKTGDIITFGYYPQTEVTDSSLISKLNSQPKTWVSYGYYSGNDESGSMKKGDWMKYADITYNGKKYRAVTFSQYRPEYSTFASTEDYARQYENGYKVNTTYYFKYEPLQWRVLDPATGLVMCEKIIDAQSFSNTVYDGENAVDSYNNPTLYTNANDYETSSVRKWLNYDFYNLVFSKDEKALIKNTTLDNICPYDSYYDGVRTKDNVFLLSYYDVTNSDYGFDSDATVEDVSRRTVATDYARCQGYYSYWWMRTPYKLAGVPMAVEESGWAAHYYGLICTAGMVNGIRPAIKIGT